MFENQETIQLLNGDCLSLLPSIPDGSIDTIICDLPYGTTKAKWDCVIDLEALWLQYRRIIKKNGAVILFGAQPFTSRLVISASDWFQYMWYWEREKGTNFLSTRYQPLRVIEEIVVFAENSKFTYNPQMIALDKPYRHTMPIKNSTLNNTFASQQQDPSDREYKTYTHAMPKNIVRFARDRANKSLVPTQKPVALMEYVVRTYTNPGDVVLDNTMGSGTTGVACVNLGRRFIGMELEERHFEIARDRIHSAMPWEMISVTA